MLHAVHRAVLPGRAPADGRNAALNRLNEPKPASSATCRTFASLVTRSRCACMIRCCSDEARRRDAERPPEQGRRVVGVQADGVRRRRRGRSVPGSVARRTLAICSTLRRRRLAGRREQRGARAPRAARRASTPPDAAGGPSPRAAPVPRRPRDPARGRRAIAPAAPRRGRRRRSSGSSTTVPASSCWTNGSGRPQPSTHASGTVTT